MIIDEEYVIGVLRDLFEKYYTSEMEPREIEYSSEKAYLEAYEAWYNSVYLPSMG
jgi:hypothetical protein